MTEILLVASGGAAGALARYGLSNLVHAWLGPGFPWGTWLVNLLGCFFFGLTWALLLHRAAPLAQVRLFVFAGFLGAFTTFSTFAFESERLWASSGLWLCGVNLVGQTLLGLAAVLGGLALGRVL